MKRYKVQWAYAVDIGSPVMHSREASAAGEVAHLLGTWIRRNLTDYLKRLEQFPDKHPEFREALRFLVPELQRLIGSGQVWEAYSLWEDFYVNFEDEFDMPLYVAIGTVIVEGSPETGLRNLLPLLEKTDVPPMEKYGSENTAVINRLETLKMDLLEELWGVVQRKAELKGIRIHPEMFLKTAEAVERAITGKFHYMDEASEAQYLAELREGILRKIFPKPTQMGLGVIRSWLVQYADFAGMRHGARHTSENRAKSQAGDYLMILLTHLGTHIGGEVYSERSAEYVQEGQALVERIHLLLSDDQVWTAYREYKAFEQKWNHFFSPFSLDTSIGSMRVVPTPEPEA